MASESLTPTHRRPSWPHAQSQSVKSGPVAARIAAGGRRRQVAAPGARWVCFVLSALTPPSGRDVGGRDTGDCQPQASGVATVFVTSRTLGAPARLCSSPVSPRSDGQIGRNARTVRRRLARLLASDLRAHGARIVRRSKSRADEAFEGLLGGDGFVDPFDDADADAEAILADNSTSAAGRSRADEVFEGLLGVRTAVDDSPGQAILGDDEDGLLLEEEDDLGMRNEGVPRWLKDLHVVGFDPQLEFYNKFILEAADKGDLAAAERWFRNAKRAGVDPDETTYRALIDAACGGGDLAGAERWVETAARHGVSPSRSVVVSLLEVAAKQGNLEFAVRWFPRACGGQKARSTTSTDSSAYAAVIAAAARCGDLEAAENWFDAACAAGYKPNSVAFTNIMAAHAKRGDLVAAERWHARAKAAGIRPNIVAFNTLINAAAKDGNLTAAERWFNDAGDAGACTNIITFTTLIDAAARLGDFEAAQRWFQRAAEADVHLTTPAFNAVLKAACRTGDLQAAERLLDSAIAPTGADAGSPATSSQDSGKVTSATLPPVDVVSFNTIIGAASRAGDVGTAEHWFSRLGEARADGVTFVAMVTAAARAGDIAAAERWFTRGNRTLRRNRRGQAQAYTAMISAAAKAGNASAAERWFEEAASVQGVKLDAALFNAVIGVASAPEEWLKRAQSFGVAPDVRTFNTLISAEARRGDLVAAERWFAQAAEVGCTPSLVTFTSVVNAAARAGNLCAAEAWFTRAEQAGLQPDVVLLTALVVAASREGNTTAAEDWFRRASSTPGIKLDVTAHTAVVEAYSRAGDMANAERCFERIYEDGLVPLEKSFSAVINGHALLGNVEAATKWFGMMESRGLPGTSVQYNQLFGACARARPRRADKAEELFRRMLEHRVEPSKATLQSLRWALGSEWFSRLCQEVGLDRTCHDRGRDWREQVPPLKEKRSSHRAQV